MLKEISQLFLLILLSYTCVHCVENETSQILKTEREKLNFRAKITQHLRPLAILVKVKPTL